MSSTITLIQAQAQLQSWLDASTALATSEEYSIGNRKLKRSDSDMVLKMIKYWENKVGYITRGNSTKVKRIVIRDDV